jgi:hypothetical protein
MKHGLEEASATVRRCHIFGRGEAIWSIPVSKEVSVTLDLDCELCTQTTCPSSWRPQRRWGDGGRPGRSATVQELILLEVGALIDKGPNFLVHATDEKFRKHLNFQCKETACMKSQIIKRLAPGQTVLAFLCLSSRCELCNLAIDSRP